MIFLPKILTSHDFYTLKFIKRIIFYNSAWFDIDNSHYYNYCFCFQGLTLSEESTQTSPHIHSTVVIASSNPVNQNTQRNNIISPSTSQVAPMSIASPNNAANTVEQNTSSVRNPTNSTQDSEDSSSGQRL